MDCPPTLNACVRAGFKSYALSRTKLNKYNKTFKPHITPALSKHMEYLCLDIKYVWVHGEGRWYYLLSIMDVFSRKILHWIFQKSVRQMDVINMFGWLHTVCSGITLSENTAALGRITPQQKWATGLSCSTDKQRDQVAGAAVSRPNDATKNQLKNHSLCTSLDTADSATYFCLEVEQENRQVLHILKNDSVQLLGG